SSTRGPCGVACGRWRLLRGLRRVVSALVRPLRGTRLRMLGRRSIGQAAAESHLHRAVSSHAASWSASAAACLVVSSFLVCGVVSQGLRFQTNQLRTNVLDVAPCTGRPWRLLLSHPSEVNAC